MDRVWKLIIIQTFLPVHDHYCDYLNNYIMITKECEQGFFIFFFYFVRSPTKSRNAQVKRIKDKKGNQRIMSKSTNSKCPCIIYTNWPVKKIRPTSSSLSAPTQSELNKIDYSA